jgi:hypothetical protein
VRFVRLIFERISAFTPPYSPNTYKNFLILLTGFGQCADVYFSTARQEWSPFHPSFCSTRMENSMKSILLPVIAIMMLTGMAILSLSPGFVSADEYSQPNMQSRDDNGSENMSMGMHSMSGTIENINSQTGWMKIKTGIGELTIHYPAPAVKDLKKGDKITVHLSYTKGEDRMKHDMMMK